MKVKAKKTDTMEVVVERVMQKLSEDDSNVVVDAVLLDPQDFNVYEPGKKAFLPASATVEDCQLHDDVWRIAVCTVGPLPWLFVSSCVESMGCLSRRIEDQTSLCLAVLTRLCGSRMSDATTVCSSFFSSRRYEWRP